MMLPTTDDPCDDVSDNIHEWITLTETDKELNNVH